MNRNLCLAVLMYTVGGVALADEPGLCKSMCASEQRVCRKDALKLTELDKLPSVEAEETNPMARVASQGQFATAPARAAEQQDFHRRKAERTGRCDTTFQGCVRACAPSDASSGASEILTTQGRDKRSSISGETH